MPDWIGKHRITQTTMLLTNLGFIVFFMGYSFWNFVIAGGTTGATSDDESFNSGTRSQGDTFTFTFNETGTFPYHCRFHGDNGGVGMAGTIIVQ